MCVYLQVTDSSIKDFIFKLQASQNDVHVQARLNAIHHGKKNNFASGLYVLYLYALVHTIKRIG